MPRETTVELFAATMRPSQIIGREKELERIRQAIFRPFDDKSTQLVLIKGAGGLGKTRLLETVLWRMGHPSERNERDPLLDTHVKQGLDWSGDGDVVILPLIDLIDIELHARSNFIEALYLGFQQSGVLFHRFTGKAQRYHQLVQQGMEFSAVEQAAEQMLQAFYQDYQEAAAEKRIVWVIDTAEQLSHVTSEWLINRRDSSGRRLLRPEDLRFQTRQWLVDEIQKDALPNTTFLIAGRAEQGKPFFEAVENAARVRGIKPTTIAPEPFKSPQLVRKYFAQLATDWKELAHERPVGARDRIEAELAQRIGGDLQVLLDQDYLIENLYHYTGGQPVLLSLFADLLLEQSIDPPPELTARHRREAAAKVVEDELESAWRRWQIEDSFIRLMFLPDRGTQSLYRDILLLLVRSPRGLSYEQIHYLLDNKENVQPEHWQATPSRLEEIEQTVLTWQRRSTLLKSRQNGVGLQDEIYRIFAEHMAPHVAPSEKQVMDLWQEKMSDEQRALYEKRYKEEKEARGEQYRRLRAWAKLQTNRLQKNQVKIRLEEERFLEAQLAVLAPTDHRSLNWRPTKGPDEGERQNLYRELLWWQVEYMHYDLLLNFGESFNTTYTDLADARTLGHDEDRDVVIQDAMWRLLRDEWAMKFAFLPDRERTKRRQETELQVLRRAASQEDVVRWLKRFIMVRKEYDRAVQLADAVEAIVNTMPDRANNETIYDRDSWAHTLSRGERAAWKEYALIMLSDDLQPVIARLRSIVGELEMLAGTSVGKPVFPKRGELGEEGFSGHPAEVRLKRVISLIYNFIGYGRASLRDFRQALLDYGRALYFARGTGAHLHRAYIINNLSRVESELGRRGRPLRLCYDALNLRREAGADYPIALSHSTLALIYNDQNRPDEAWKAAAKAVAYARRMQDDRALVLSLKHLGEALRRLAGQETKSYRRGRVAPADPGALYYAAENVLEEAHRLLTESSMRREPLRLVETFIELGCLHRDWLAALDRDTQKNAWLSHRGRALGLLRDASEVAHELELTELQIDALVNLVWTYFQARELDTVSEEAEKAEEIIVNAALARGESDPRLHEDGKGLSYGDHRPMVYYQLAKLHHVLGRADIELFRRRADTIGAQFPGEENRQLRSEKVAADELAQSHLRNGAGQFVQAVIYAQLFSSRAGAISAVYDSLYNYLVRFNQQELDDFARYERHYNDIYGGDQIELESFGMPRFLQESFGINGANGIVK